MSIYYIKQNILNKIYKLDIYIPKIDGIFFCLSQ